MMLGTLLHNLFHGVVLYSAFAISVEFGVGLTIAILLHSIPQNLANFIMNHRKFQSIILAAMGGILGALLCYPFGDFILAHKFIILGITAGGLLYLALTDILPHMDDKGKKFGKFQYFALVIAGILLVQSFDHISESLMGDHHHDDHQVSHGDEHHNV
ncbi:MAG: hypothetical protein U9Q15_00455 [Patescibacteria group bacterium]|nr:hypothetical protein [Patescibacteria group bacterium]